MTPTMHVAFVRDCALHGFYPTHGACHPVRATGMAAFLRSIGSEDVRLLAVHPDGSRDETGIEGAGEHWGDLQGGGLLLHEASESERIRLSVARYPEQPRDWRAALPDIASAHRWALLDWSGEWDLSTLAFVTADDRVLEAFLASLSTCVNTSWGDVPALHPELVRVHRGIRALDDAATIAVIDTDRRSWEDEIRTAIVAALGAPSAERDETRDERDRILADATSNGADVAELAARLRRAEPILAHVPWCAERFEWVLVEGLGFHEHPRTLVSCRDPQRLRSVLAELETGGFTVSAVL